MRRTQERNILQITGSFPNIKNRLHQEHGSEFVYRGQIKEWPGPLVPSLFRPFIPSRNSFDYNGENRLRKVGIAFIEEFSPQEAMARLSVEQMSVVQRRLAVAQELRHAFGYPLSQVFAQQAGLGSEGLDVTRDINVAAFFATHLLVNDTYVPVTNGEGVIYRFSIDEPNITFSDLNDYDFYSCPSYLPSIEIIQHFGNCSTTDASIRSLLDYHATHFARIAEDPEKARRNRPFDVIKFPPMSRYYSRIVQQNAGLIIPDMLLTDSWSEIEVPAPEEKVGWTGEPCIEDLRKRPGTSVFRFAHTPENQSLVNVIRDVIFADDDIICFLLRIWLSRIFGSDMLLFRDSVFFADEDASDLIT